MAHARSCIFVTGVAGLQHFFATLITKLLFSLRFLHNNTLLVIDSAEKIFVFQWFSKKMHHHAKKVLIFVSEYAE